MNSNLTSRDGLYRVTGSTWRGDGTFTVRVVEMIGERPEGGTNWDRGRRRKARDLARRVDDMRKIRSVRIVSEVFEDGQTAWQLVASRYALRVCLDS